MQSGSSVKVCEKCNKLTKPLVSKSLPRMSEWYCETCHKSYLMNEHEVETVTRTMGAR